MFGIYILFTAVVGQSPSSGLDSDRLNRLLSAISVDYDDVNFEFEGSIYFPRKEYCESFHLGDDGLYDAFSGRFAYRKDGATLIDIFHRFAPKNDMHRKTVAVHGGRGTIYERNSEGRGGGGEITAEDSFHHNFDASYGRLFCINELRCNLNYPKAKMLHRGSETIDGNRCEVIEFVFGGEPIDFGKASIKRYWIDFGRGAHALKIESWARGQLQNRTSGIELKRFFPRAGLNVWLPYHGVYRIHQIVDREGNRSYVEEPSTVEDIWLVPSSVKFNQKLPDSYFSVKFKPGTPISDKLRQVQYEFGQDRRPPPTSVAESEQRLKEYLDEAGKQEGELVAASAARSGPGWAEWAPWGVAGVAIVALVAVLVRNRMAG